MISPLLSTHAVKGYLFTACVAIRNSANCMILAKKQNCTVLNLEVLYNQIMANLPSNADEILSFLNYMRKKVFFEKKNSILFKSRKTLQ